MQRAFEHSGLPNRLFVVSDGREALDYLQGTGLYADRQSYPLPGLLLLDLKMPTMNGFEVLEWLQAHSEFSRLPIVILSGSGLTADVHRAEKLGLGFGYMQKAGKEGIAQLLQLAQTPNEPSEVRRAALQGLFHIVGHDPSTATGILPELVAGKERIMEFLTNNLEWSACSVADLYRCRWQIEIFFKSLKQNLQIGSMLGYNANAVRWQIWMALLVHLLMRFLKWQSRWQSHFGRLFTIVRCAMWFRWDLGSWLKFYGTAGLKRACEPMSRKRIYRDLSKKAVGQHPAKITMKLATPRKI